MVICLERGADLHMAQLMPLPLTVSCFSKIQIGFTFLVPAHAGSPGQKALNARVCCGCWYWPKVFPQYVRTRQISQKTRHSPGVRLQPQSLDWKLPGRLLNSPLIYQQKADTMHHCPTARHCNHIVYTTSYHYHFIHLLRNCLTELHFFFLVIISPPEQWSLQ